jgi:hypothetical protein
MKPSNEHEREIARIVDEQLARTKSPPTVHDVIAGLDFTMSFRWRYDHPISD